MLFSREDLKKLIFPLVLEQILAVTIGMADTAMVASCGEAAVSGISLVDTLNILLINLFAALATGGAVVCSQYLGRDARDEACSAAKQLFFVMTIAAVLIMVVSLVFRDGLLRIAFGEITPDVMESARIYFLLTALSFPFLAVYNASAALMRAMGDAKTPLMTAVLMNLINIVGNSLLIFVFHWGVFGAALATLVSRAVGAAIMAHLIRAPHRMIFVHRWLPFQFHGAMVGRILRIGVPNGLENSMFQFGKVLVQGLVAACGTTAMAANAVANQVANMQVIPGSAIGLAMLTVVGRCIGAGETDQARDYTKRLMRLVYITTFGLNLLVFALGNPILRVFQLTPETAKTAYWLMMYHSVLCVLIWPLSFVLPNALRAAGDARFTMVVSILSMWICRVVLSYVMVQAFGWGVQGVWIAMTADWAVRGVFFVWRFCGKAWLNKRVI